MNDNTLNLSFPNWRVFLLSIIPTLINVGIIVYVRLFLAQNKINKTFFLSVLLLGITQIIAGKNQALPILLID